MTVSVPWKPTPSKPAVIEPNQARDRHRAAFEGGVNGMLILDDDTWIIDANPTAAEMYGLDRRDLLGQPIREFLSESIDSMQSG